jgi:hypothetical protein
MYAVSLAWKSSSYNSSILGPPVFYMSIQLIGVSTRSSQPRPTLRDNLKPSLCNIEHIGVLAVRLQMRGDGTCHL